MTFPDEMERWYVGGWIQSGLSDLSHMVAIERLGKRLITRVSWNGPAFPRRVALTFDDGPHPEFTPQLLSILHAHDVKASFFLVGRHVERNARLVGAIAGAGHDLCNHTYSHPLMMTRTTAHLREEIGRTEELIRRYSGRQPVYFRPPMGLFSRRILDIVESMGYRTVIGDVYPRDPHLPGADRIVRRVLSRVRPGSIIILHDGGNIRHVDRSQTIRAVREIIPALKARGLECVTLSTLFA